MGEQFKGKVALVTGAASGIGYAITEELINKGAKVVGCDIDEAKLDDIKGKFSDSFLGVKADVTKEEDHKRFIKESQDRFGQIDYAFNVAGAAKQATIVDLDYQDWKFTVDLCLDGVFLGMKHQAKAMKANNGGAIVNIASLNAQVPMYGGSAYASAKAGVEMLTRNGALEMASDNIRVNAILPGLVETPLTSGFTDNQEMYDHFMERIPMKRPAEPKEIAKPSIFLVSDDASYVNGSSLFVDGAWNTSVYPDLSKFM